MSLLEIIVLAVALAMDATAVAGTRGLAATKVRVRDAAVVAAFFGGAQAAMPALGWIAGAAFATRIMGWGHWVTFVVLGGIGVKMIHEALEVSDEAAAKKAAADPFGSKVLALLAVATSIDALAAGFTIAVRGANVALSCTVIGVVTAVLSFGGVFAGHRFGARLGKRLDVLGGLVLVGLAVRTLIAHYRGG